MYNVIICRYAEIAIKGKNRGNFESLLVDHIRGLLAAIEKLKVRRIRGRVLIGLEGGAVFSPEQVELAKKQLPKAFGIQNFSLGTAVPANLEAIKAAVSANIDGMLEDTRNRLKKPKLSFRVRARRSDKTFPLRSKQLEVELADLVIVNHMELTVDLNNADVSLYLEVGKEKAFVYFDTLEGPGGLPLNSNPPVLCLLSGGIDSPAAAYLIMKRGCRSDFLTFHSSPYTPPESLEKVRDIVRVLNSFQLQGTLFACNLAEVQKLIRDNCAERFRTLLYRRAMFRLAERIAARNGNKALVTGECVGQVASQTLANLANIDTVTSGLVLRPLIGLDKLDIIKIAEKIHTFEISKLQVPDSCTVFAPSSPSTAAPRRYLELDEAKLDPAKLTELAWEHCAAIDLETMAETPLSTFFPPLPERPARRPQQA